MSEMTRKMHTGEVGNKGEFGSHMRDEADVAVLAPTPRVDRFHIANGVLEARTPHLVFDVETKVARYGEGMPYLSASVFLYERCRRGKGDYLGGQDVLLRLGEDGELVYVDMDVSHGELNLEPAQRDDFAAAMSEMAGQLSR